MKNRLDELVRRYERHVLGLWSKSLPGAQKVVFVVYPTDLERSIRARIEEFAQVTRAAGRDWREVDATRWFSQWITDNEYREEWFEDPELLAPTLEEEFPRFAADRLNKALTDSSETGVVALTGVASLYGFLRVSNLIRRVEPEIRGRLVIFFPGTKDGTNYRLLDARDGWNYLAQAITLHDGS